MQIHPKVEYGLTCLILTLWRCQSTVHGQNPVASNHIWTLELRLQFLTVIFLERCFLPELHRVRQEHPYSQHNENDCNCSENQEHRARVFSRMVPTMVTDTTASAQLHPSPCPLHVRTHPATCASWLHHRSSGGRDCYSPLQKEKLHIRSLRSLLKVMELTKGRPQPWLCTRILPLHGAQMRPSGLQ